MNGRQIVTYMVLFFSMLLPACGILEVGIEQTATPTVSLTTPTSPPQTDTATPPPTAVPAGMEPIDSEPTPTATPTPWEGNLYTNSYYNISLIYPPDWSAVPGYSTYGDKFEGADGYFIVNAAGGGSIEEIVSSEAEHRLRPYGSNPLIAEADIQGQEARFIWPSDDASMPDQAALIVPFPRPVTISGVSYEYLILYADVDNLPDLAQSLRFASASAADFWTEAGLSPDALLVLLMRQGEEPTRFGDIATMHADGTELNRITTYRFNADPVLSPDGRRIAYRSVPITITSLPNPGSRLYEGLYNIWVITVDGETAWQLTRSEALRSLPTWSADSQRVAFSQGTDGELIEVEVNSQTPRLVTRGAFSPRYRPDGNGIGYISESGDLVWRDDAGIVSTILSGADLPENTFVNDFDWFADGQHILYTLADDSERQIEDLTIGVEYTVWIASADGADHVQVADDLHDIYISPDNQIIAGLQGTGFGDACLVDSQLRLLRLSSDRSATEEIPFEEFSGYPPPGLDQSFYPLTSITWVAPHVAHVEFGLTCAIDQSAAGWYLIDPLQQRMMQVTGG